MLNKKPVIVNGYGRGGTNILMNLLLSHSDLVMPTGEMNKVIKGGALGEGVIKKIYKKILYDFPLRAMCRGDYFNRFALTERSELSNIAQKYIDYIFWIEKQ